jgi:NNP family nitrate/nitrite transporter-like MFS transporter
MQLAVIAGLLAAWTFGIHSFAQIPALGIVPDIGVATFAIALPMMSHWYPPEHQGMA